MGGMSSTATVISTAGATIGAAVGSAIEDKKPKKLRSAEDFGKAEP